MRASLLALVASGVLASSPMHEAWAEGRGGGLQRAMNPRAIGAATAANRVAIAPATVSDAAGATNAAPSGLSQATGGLSRAGGGLGRATPGLTGAAAGMARPAQGMPKLPTAGLPGAGGARPLPANAISIPRPDVVGGPMTTKPFPGNKLPGNAPMGDLTGDVRMQPPVGRPTSGQQPGTPGMQPPTAQQLLDRRTMQAEHVRAVGEQNGNDRLTETADRMQDRAQQNFVRRTEHVEGVRPDGARPEGIRPDVGRPDGARPDGGRPEGTRPGGVRPESVSQGNAANGTQVDGVPTDGGDINVPSTPPVSTTPPSTGAKWTQRLKKLWPFGRKSE